MSRIIKCDRCGGEVNPKKIGYVSMMERKDGDQLVGENPFEQMDFCEGCMKLIKEFVSNATPKRTAKPKTDRGAERKQGASVDPPKKEEAPKKPVDKGRIVALANAGWKVKDIALDARCSEATVYNVLKEAKKTSEPDN